MAEAAARLLDCEQMVPAPGTDALLASLRDQDGERFDAAGWHYLGTLARRAAGHEGSVRRLLEAKLERAVAAFAERFAQARAAAAAILAATCAAHPQAAAELQQLFADNDFLGLRRLRATLEARKQGAVLAELVSHLEPVLVAAPGRPSAHQAIPRAAAAASPNLELKTVRESRATWARMSVEKQLAQAMKQGPQNAGPINSHMLILRSLAMMQDISPDYLSRMVSYADTLIFLNPVDKEMPVKRKKAAPAKVRKPSKSI